MSEQKNQATSQGATVGKTTLRYLKSLVSIVMRILLILLFVVGFFFSVVPWGRAAARSTLLLPALVTASEPAPLTLSGEPVRYTAMTVPSLSGTVYLDLYEPAAPTPLISGTRSGVLIIAGAGDNRKVPQLINLSQSLARTGLIVMDMTTPTLINYDLSALDGDAAVQAFQTLAHLPEMKGSRIGIIAFSAGVPIACFAAADPRIRNEVAYVTNFGGYFNTRNVLRAFGRRALSVDGTTRPWQPTAVPIEVLSNVITKPLAQAEKEKIRQALAPGGRNLTASDLAHVSSAGRAAYHLLKGDEPEQVDANIKALSAPIQAQLEELSPNRVVDQIRAPIFLLHDRNDMSLPFTESRDFAAALARINHPYEHVEFGIFDHVQVRSHLDTNQLLGDGSHLFNILSAMLFVSSQKG